MPASNPSGSTFGRNCGLAHRNVVLNPDRSGNPHRRQCLDDNGPRHRPVQWCRPVVTVDPSSGKEPARIEYHGLSGISIACRDAVFRFLQYGDEITHARILTSGTTHCLLLSTNDDDLIAIRSGFASGYNGSGPNALSVVLGTLDAVGTDIDEHEVAPDIIKKINESLLTAADIDNVLSSRPVRPKRWDHYILDNHWNGLEIDAHWHKFPYVIPFALIDCRITDLAISFWKEPDDRLMKGYRRLEDIVRKRTGCELHGNKLFGQVFSVKNGMLKWKNANNGEQAGRLDLFKGTYGAYRNARAHRELDGRNEADLLNEFLLLNHLYRLESEAVDVIRDKQQLPGEETCGNGG